MDASGTKYPPNPAYAYAISPIIVALFWPKGGREIAESGPTSAIFTILTHVPNTTAANNYFVVIKQARATPCASGQFLRLRREALPARRVGSSATHDARSAKLQATRRRPEQPGDELKRHPGTRTWIHPASPNERRGPPRAAG